MWDSHRMVFTFLSSLDFLGVALAFRIFILKIFELSPSYLHRITYTTSFEKHLESSLGHTLTFYLNLVKYRFKNNSEGISHPVFYGDLVYKLRRIKCEANYVLSGSKIVERLRRQKYDLAIIDRTICLVLGPSTALCRYFLKHCTLTNKVIGTIWRDLSKPPQRRQRSSPRPLWLLVGTAWVLGPGLAYSLRVAQPT